MNHSKFGYSAVNDFKSCPFKYDLTWNQNLEVLDDYDPTNSLKIGTALHKAIETDFETAAQEYYDSFPVIGDAHITEMMKVKIQAKKVKQLFDENGMYAHEYHVEHDDFIGTIDLLEYTHHENGTFHFNMYDFKYSNNIDNYRDSIQLMVYKHFFELTNSDCVVDKMFFIVIPKSNLKQGNDDLFRYRQRIIEDLKTKEPILIESVFDKNRLQEYFDAIEEIKNTKVFPKTENKFCYWCKYKDYCLKGVNYMLLPSNERRQVGNPTKKKIWIYGASMSGKTTFLDKAPDPLNLNTDGNIQFVTMPFIPIKDEVTVNGRITSRKFAWEVFKDAISELEKKQNDFKTIIVDLVEDTREMCRLYKYDEMGIQHESDSGYGKGWDIIKTEYLSVIRRLFNLDYENIIVVSHETISEVKKKNGQTITKIAPNIQEAIANKIAGMVDIVARVVVEDDGSRTLNFKSNEYIFGGGRLKNLQVTQIPLDWDELMNVYGTRPEEKTILSVASEHPVEVPFDMEEVEIVKTPPTEVRTRRSRTKAEEPKTIESGCNDSKIVEIQEVKTTDGSVEAPKRRTRRVRN